MQTQEFENWFTEKRLEQLNKRNLNTELEYPQGYIPITDYLAYWAKNAGDRPAIIFYGRVITYRELDEYVNRFANFLNQRGLGPGDYVGIQLYNCPQYFFAHFGGLRAGCVIIPIDPLWREIELEAPFEDTGMKLIVTQDLNYEVVKKVVDRFGGCEIVTTSFQDFLPEERPFPFLSDLETPKKLIPGTVDLMTALNDCPIAPPGAVLQMDAPASLDYTGGTTARSKACLHTQGGITYTRACMHTYLGVGDCTGGAILFFVPAFHTAGRGMLEAGIMDGMTTILLTRFDPLAVLTAIPMYHPQLMWGPSDLYDAVSKMPEEQLGSIDFSSFKYLLCTQYNVPLTEELRSKWADISRGGLLVDVTYGLTETLSMNTGIIGFQDVDLKKQQQNGGVFVGLPVPETIIKIVDIDGQIQPPMEVGEIAIKDPALSPDYFKQPEETAKCYLPDGFLRTGDLGMYDEDGFLYYKGRTKEVIKVSGFTVSPREIELIIGRHEGVKAVAVVGAPDERQGEVPVAFIVLEPGRGDLDTEAFTSWCKEMMSGYKVPKRVIIKEQLPTLLGLKVDRRKLQEEARHVMKT